MEHKIKVNFIFFLGKTDYYPPLCPTIWHSLKFLTLFSVPLAKYFSIYWQVAYLELSAWSCLIKKFIRI